VEKLIAFLKRTIFKDYQNTWLAGSILALLMMVVYNISNYTSGEVFFGVFILMLSFVISQISTNRIANVKLWIYFITCIGPLLIFIGMLQFSPTIRWLGRKTIRDVMLDNSVNEVLNINSRFVCYLLVIYFVVYLLLFVLSKRNGKKIGKKKR